MFPTSGTQAERSNHSCPKSSLLQSRVLPNPQIPNPHGQTPDSCILLFAMDADSVKNRRYTPDDLPDQLACVYAHEYLRRPTRIEIAYYLKAHSLICIVMFRLNSTHMLAITHIPHFTEIDSHNFLIGGLISALGLPITVLYTNTFTYLLTY